MSKSIHLARVVSRDSTRGASARAVSIERRAARAMRSAVPVLDTERLARELSNGGTK